MTRLQLPYPPSVNHYYRRVGARTLISREGREYRETVISRLRGVASLDGPVSISVDVYPPDRRRRDLDNILKPLLDALQHAGAYRDDSQIVQINACKLDPMPPLGLVVVWVGNACLKPDDDDK